MASERRGMGMGGALFLLFVIGGAFFTVDRVLSRPMLDDGVHATGSCYSEDSGELRLGPLGANKSSIRDDDCEMREAARLAGELGMDTHAKAIVCSLSGSVQAFGNKDACMRYAGDFRVVAAETDSRQDYCKRRSKKWYRKLTFTGGKIYRRCMRGEV